MAQAGGPSVLGSTRVRRYKNVSGSVASGDSRSLRGGDAASLARSSFGELPTGVGVSTFASVSSIGGLSDELGLALARASEGAGVGFDPTGLSSISLAQGSGGVILEGDDDEGDDAPGPHAGGPMPRAVRNSKERIRVGGRRAVRSRRKAPIRHKRNVSGGDKHRTVVTALLDEVRQVQEKTAQLSAASFADARGSATQATPPRVPVRKAATTGRRGRSPPRRARARRTSSAVKAPATSDGVAFGATPSPRLEPLQYESQRRLRANLADDQSDKAEPSPLFAARTPAQRLPAVGAKTLSERPQDPLEVPLFRSPNRGTGRDHDRRKIQSAGGTERLTHVHSRARPLALGSSTVDGSAPRPDVSSGGSGEDSPPSDRPHTELRGGKAHVSAAKPVSLVQQQLLASKRLTGVPRASKRSMWAAHVAGLADEFERVTDGLRDMKVELHKLSTLHQDDDLTVPDSATLARHFYMKNKGLRVPRAPTREEYGRIEAHLAHAQLHPQQQRNVRKMGAHADFGGGWGRHARLRHTYLGALIQFQARWRGYASRQRTQRDLRYLRLAVARGQYVCRRDIERRLWARAVRHHSLKVYTLVFHTVRKYTSELMQLADGKKRALARKHFGLNLRYKVWTALVNIWKERTAARRQMRFMCNHLVVAVALHKFINDLRAASTVRYKWLRFARRARRRRFAIQQRFLLAVDDLTLNSSRQLAFKHLAKQHYCGLSLIPRNAPDATSRWFADVYDTAELENDARMLERLESGFYGASDESRRRLSWRMRWMHEETILDCVRAADRQAVQLARSLPGSDFDATEGSPHHEQSSHVRQVAGFLPPVRKHRTWHRRRRSLPSRTARKRDRLERVRLRPSERRRRAKRGRSLPAIPSDERVWVSETLWWRNPADEVRGRDGRLVVRRGVAGICEGDATGEAHFGVDDVSVLRAAAHDSRRHVREHDDKHGLSRFGFPVCFPPRRVTSAGNARTTAALVQGAVALPSRPSYVEGGVTEASTEEAANLSYETQPAALDKIHLGARNGSVSSAAAGWDELVARVPSARDVVGLGRWRVFRAWKRRWEPYHAQILKARAFWVLHDSPRYGTIRGYCLARLSKHRKAYNFGVLPRCFRGWALWKRDRLVSRGFKKQSAEFRMLWSQKRAISTLRLNIGIQQRRRQAAHLFMPGLKVRSFRKWALNVRSQRNLKEKLHRHRIKWVVRGTFSEWRRGMVRRGQQAAILHTMEWLLGVVEEDGIMQKGIDVWQQLWNRRVFDALRLNAETCVASRLAYTYWMRHMFNRWKRLKAVNELEWATAVKLQCMWRQRQARGEYLKAVRMFNLTKYKQAEKEADKKRTEFERIMKIRRLVARWKRHKERVKAERAAQAAADAHAATIRLEAMNSVEAMKKTVAEFEAKRHEEFLHKKATLIQSWMKAIHFRAITFYTLVIMHKTAHIRESEAARRIQRMYRNKNKVLTKNAITIQTAYRAYRGRRAGALQARINKLLVRRALHYKFLDRFSRYVLGNKSFQKRRTRYEWLELFGIVQPDPWAAIENEEREKRRRIIEARAKRAWIIKEGSNRDRQLLFLKEKYINRNRRKFENWVKRQLSKIRPAANEKLLFREELPYNVRKQLAKIAQQERIDRTRELRTRKLMRHAAALRIQKAFRGKKFYFLYQRKRRKRLLRAQHNSNLMRLEKFGIHGRGKQERWMRKLNRWGILSMEPMVVSQPLKDAHEAVLAERQWGRAEAREMAKRDPFWVMQHMPAWRWRVKRMDLEARYVAFIEDRERKREEAELKAEEEEERQLRKMARRDVLGDDEYYDSSDIQSDSDVESTDSLLSMLSSKKDLLIGSRPGSRGGSRPGSRMGRRPVSRGARSGSVSSYASLTQTEGLTTRPGTAVADDGSSIGSKSHLSGRPGDDGASVRSGASDASGSSRGSRGGSRRGSVASARSDASNRSKGTSVADERAKTSASRKRALTRGSSRRPGSSRRSKRKLKADAQRKHYDHSHHDDFIELVGIIDDLCNKVEVRVTEPEVEAVVEELVTTVSTIEGMLLQLEEADSAAQHATVFGGLPSVSEVSSDVSEGKGIEDVVQEGAEDRQMRENYEISVVMMGMITKIEEEAEAEVRAAAYQLEVEREVANVVETLVLRVENPEISSLVTAMVDTVEKVQFMRERNGSDVDIDFAKLLNESEAAGRAAALLAGKKYRKGEMFRVPGKKLRISKWKSGFNYSGLPARLKYKEHEDPERARELAGADGNDVHSHDRFKFPSKYGGTSLYMGWWRNGRPHGVGKAMFRRDNAAGLYSVDGEWERGHWNGQMTIQWINGSFYKGLVRKGYFNGHGEHVVVVDDKRLDALVEFLQRQQKLKEQADQRDDDPAGPVVEGGPTIGGAAGKLLKRRRSSIMREAAAEAQKEEDERQRLEKEREERDAQLRAAAEAAKAKVGKFGWGEPDVYDLNSSEDELEPFKPPWIDARELPTPWERYVGGFRKGKRHGARFRCRLADGTLYEGNMTQDKFNGHGTFKYPNGDVYTGTIRDNVRTGRGVLTYADGTVYEGEFHDEHPHGHGTRRFPNGDYFVGTWRHGVKHGRLTLFYANGDRREGEWGRGYLRRWLCARITKEDTEGILSFFEAGGSALTSLLAQNVIQRWRYYAKGERCERVPPGVDPDDPRVDPTITAITEALSVIKREEANERLRREVDVYKGNVNGAVKALEEHRERMEKVQIDIEAAQAHLRDMFAHLDEVQQVMDGEQASTGVVRKKEIVVYEGYRKGMRVCKAHLSEKKLANLASYVEAPEILVWTMSALHMLMQDDVTPPSWEEIRRVMYAGNPRNRRGIVSCEAYHKKMATFDPSTVGPDVVASLEDLYMDHPRFSDGYMKSSAEVLPGMRDDLQAVVDWIRYVYGCYVQSQKIAVLDGRLAKVQELVDARHARWAAAKESLRPLQVIMAGLEERLVELRNEEYRYRKELDYWSTVYHEGRALEVEEAEEEVAENTVVEDDEFHILAGGDIEKLKRMLNQAELQSELARAKWEEQKRDRVNLMLQIDKIKTTSLQELENKRVPQWATAKEEFRRVTDEMLVAMNEAGGWSPPGPISVVGRCAAVIFGENGTWKAFQDCSTIRYIAGKQDKRVVWRRRADPKFMEFFRSYDPSKLVPRQWDDLQPILKHGLCKPENFRKPTAMYNCNNFAAYALSKVVVAIDNFYSIGRFIDPIKQRVKKLEVDYRLSAKAIEVGEELWKAAEAEADHLRGVYEKAEAARKHDKVARDVED